MKNNKNIGLYLFGGAAVFTIAALLINYIAKDKKVNTEQKYTPVSITTSGGAKNNPGNIRKNPNNNWKGKIEGPGAFESFINLAYGYRALIILLRNYYKQGNKTIEKIIYKYAPEEDNNNPEAYIKFLENYTGINRKTDLAGVIFNENLRPILKGIARLEQGSNTPLDEKSIKEAFKLL